jgi:hypothetical protein
MLTKRPFLMGVSDNEEQRRTPVMRTLPPPCFTHISLILLHYISH